MIHGKKVSKIVSSKRSRSLEAIVTDSDNVKLNSITGWKDGINLLNTTRLKTYSLTQQSKDYFKKGIRF